MVEAAEARTAADSLSAALERSDFVGWDPYDALASPAIRAVARVPILRQAAIQGLKVMAAATPALDQGLKRCIPSWMIVVVFDDPPR